MYTGQKVENHNLQGVVSLNCFACGCSKMVIARDKSTWMCTGNGAGASLWPTQYFTEFFLSHTVWRVWWGSSPECRGRPKIAHDNSLFKLELVTDGLVGSGAFSVRHPCCGRQDGSDAPGHMLEAVPLPDED